ncbi:MAG: HAD family hydrolase [Actinobacteria bacterium]|nr:HAD family hydrolase [Actinomycetota bacterium]
MSRLQAVLLDYANTVVQYDRPQIEAIHLELADVLSRAVGPIDAAALGAVMDTVCVMAPLSRDRRELTPVEQMRRVLQETYGRPFAPTDRAVVDADRAYQELFVSSLRVDDRTLPALERLSARLPLGLVSNYPCGATLRRSLAALGIAEHFHPVVISGEIGYVKPHPKLFEVALAGLGVAAERVLFVGDSWPSDMVGAQAAGMATCHHRGLTSERGHEQHYASYRPDFTIEHLDELERILAAE